MHNKSHHIGNLISLVFLFTRLMLPILHKLNNFHVEQISTLAFLQILIENLSGPWENLQVLKTLVALDVRPGKFGSVQPQHFSDMMMMWMMTVLVVLVVTMMELMMITVVVVVVAMTMIGGIKWKTQQVRGTTTSTLQ